MIRTLKRGSAFKAKDGALYVADLSGKNLKSVGRRVEECEFPPFDLTETEYAKDPSLWVPTPEEIQATREKNVKQEEEWYAKRGKPLPAERREAILHPEAKQMKAAPENKQLLPEMTKDAPESVPAKEARPATCPDCGGPKQGVGYRHEGKCPRKYTAKE